MSARLHINVESMVVLSIGGASETSKRRDSIILMFRDAKVSVLEYDDSTHSLRARLVKTNSSDAIYFICSIFDCTDSV